MEFIQVIVYLIMIKLYYIDKSCHSYGIFYYWKLNIYHNEVA
jgi:hypothetical protein